MCHDVLHKYNTQRSWLHLYCKAVFSIVRYCIFTVLNCTLFVLHLFCTVFLGFILWCILVYSNVFILYYNICRALYAILFVLQCTLPYFYSTVLYCIVLYCNLLYCTVPGTAVVPWLKCAATNRKVAGSISVASLEFFSDIKSFRSHFGPGVDSASNRNEYQEHLLGVKAAAA